ncbi:MAG: ferredoxin [Firmicutes bacterium]|nr:ferredoxin [Bacillota bacterium]
MSKIVDKELVKVNKELCARCGICIDRCPLDCLHPDKDGVPYMKYKDCWYCGVCEYECPFNAITIQLPYLVR